MVGPCVVPLSHATPSTTVDERPAAVATAGTRVRADVVCPAAADRPTDRPADERPGEGGGRQAGRQATTRRRAGVVCPVADGRPMNDQRWQAGRQRPGEGDDDDDGRSVGRTDYKRRETRLSVGV